MEIQFRNMTQNDVEEIINVHKKSIYGLCKDFYSDGQMETWTGMFNHKIFNDGMKDINNIGIVAFNENKVVGYGFINIKDKEVKGMYLIPEVTKKGIGQLILKKLEASAQEHKLDELVLNSTLNAVAFYEKCGYKRIRDELFELTENCKLSCVHMAKKLRGVN